MKQTPGVSRGFCGIIAIAATLTIVTVVILATCWDARAQESPYLEYLGTEIIDANGQEEVNNTYYLHCGGSRYSVTIRVDWTDGTTEEYTVADGCESRWYVAGAVTLAEVVAATSSTNSVVRFVYLPLVAR